MPDEKTRADALRWMLTGATSAGGAQTDPDASYGEYASATEVPVLAAAITSPIANVTIDYVSGACGLGSASLTATTSDTLAFTAPSGSQGTAVTIANGETKIIEDGGDPSKYVRVTRTTADNLTGTATLTLTDVFGNAIGMDNVTAAQATAGQDEYRCLSLQNEGTADILALTLNMGTLGTQATTDSAQLSGSGAGTITTTDSFADWPDSGFAHVRTAAGATQEVVYYSSRTDTSLTVPAAGRGMLGTSATAGGATDTVDAVPGVRIGFEWGTIAAASFTGTGLDDATSGGTFKKQSDYDYRVEIDGTGTPDTFKWSDDGGSTWEATGVAITGAAQTLSRGVTVTFAATTGHTSGDYWDIACTAECQKPADANTAPSGVTFDTGLTAATGLDVGTLAGSADAGGADQVFLWLHRETPAGQESLPKALVLIESDFEAA